MIRYFVQLKHNPTQAVKFLKTRNKSQIYLIYLFLVNVSLIVFNVNLVK